MSISRRTFILTAAGSVLLPLTRSIALPSPATAGQSSEAATTYTTLSEVYNSLDGMADVDLYRSHIGFAFQHHKRRYEQAFGHKLNATWRRCMKLYPNFTQMLGLAVEQNTPILELKLDSFILPEQMP